MLARPRLLTSAMAQEFVPIASLNLNDTLRLASIWCETAHWTRLEHHSSTKTSVHLNMLGYRHSLHAIAAQLSPAQGCTGIDLLLTDTFDLHCFQTLTGTKFLLVVEPRTPDVAELLRTT